MDEKIYNLGETSKQKTASARMFEDRRLFMRFDNDFNTRYFCSESEIAGKGQLRDISANGMGLLTNKRLHVYTHMDISVNIPESDQPFITTGEVVWVERIDFDLYRAGVKLDKPELMGVWRVLNSAQKVAPRQMVNEKPKGWRVIPRLVDSLKNFFRRK